MTIDLQPVPVRQVAPPRPGAASRPSLGDTDGGAYDQSVKTIVFIGAALFSLGFLVIRDAKRGFYSGKASKAITTDELVTRLIAIAGGYYFLRQHFGKATITPW